MKKIILLILSLIMILLLINSINLTGFAVSDNEINKKQEQILDNIRNISFLLLIILILIAIIILLKKYYPKDQSNKKKIKSIISSRLKQGKGPLSIITELNKSYEHEEIKEALREILQEQPKINAP